MHNVEEIYEINLSNCKNSESLANDVISAIEAVDIKNKALKLNLGELEINQSQMVLLKSLIESYNGKIINIQTTNELTKDICIEMGININDENRLYTSEIQNAKLDELREEFKNGFENQKEEANPKTDTKNIENDLQKQVIGVYRKADEKENEVVFREDDVDFYATPTDEAVVVDTKNTMYINQTLRNGQVVDYDGNVVIIGDCHPGSEIKATGDITVWGVLGSLAHAGIKGNKEAKIRALKMNAVQLRIANCYSRRPDGGNIPYIVKSSVFTPEEARVVDDNIVLFKMAQN